MRRLKKKNPHCRAIREASSTIEVDLTKKKKRHGICPVQVGPLIMYLVHVTQKGIRQRHRRFVILGGKGRQELF
jgi:hypothetical protein